MKRIILLIIGCILIIPLIVLIGGCLFYMLIDVMKGEHSIIFSLSPTIFGMYISAGIPLYLIGAILIHHFFLSINRYGILIIETG